jgi:hypothetical protein
MRGGFKMTIKNLRLTRAESLSPATRTKFRLPDKGLVVAETRNPDLRDEYKFIGEIGLSKYLRDLEDGVED